MSRWTDGDEDDDVDDVVDEYDDEDTMTLKVGLVNGQLTSMGGQGRATMTREVGLACWRWGRKVEPVWPVWPV